MLSQSSKRSNRSARIVTPPRSKPIVIREVLVGCPPPDVSGSVQLVSSASGSAPGTAATISETVAPASPAPVSGDTTDSSTDFGWDLVSSILDNSFSFASLGRGFSMSPESKPNGPHGHIAESSAQQLTPTSPHLTLVTKSSRIPGPGTSPTTSPNSSPAKKSRLPLPTAVQKMKTALPTAKLMRRFSKQISRPVLRDSTNVAVVGDVLPAMKVKVMTVADAQQQQLKAVKDKRSPGIGVHAAETRSKGPATRKTSDAATRPPLAVQPARQPRVVGKENSAPRARRPTVVEKDGPFVNRSRLYA